MRVEAFSATAFAVFFVAVPSALGQISLPREAQQIFDAVKGTRERPKPPEQVQSPPAARESQPAESQTPQSQPKAQGSPQMAATEALENNGTYLSFKRWATGTQAPNAVPNEFKACIAEYDKLIASGISPETRVREEKYSGFHSPTSRNYSYVYTGTVREIKENWCDAGLKKITGDVAARHAPYRSALKGDKLRLVIDETHGHVKSYALPGGQYTGDAKKLAAAPVWFLDVGAPSNERQHCPSGGKRKFVRRYQFDGQHKLLGTAQKEYCGDPPASAYR